MFPWEKCRRNCLAELSGGVHNVFNCVRWRTNWPQRALQKPGVAKQVRVSLFHFSLLLNESFLSVFISPSLSPSPLHKLCPTIKQEWGINAEGLSDMRASTGQVFRCKLHSHSVKDDGPIKQRKGAGRFRDGKEKRTKERRRGQLGVRVPPVKLKFAQRQRCIQIPGNRSARQRRMILWSINATLGVGTRQILIKKRACK